MSPTRGCPGAFAKRSQTYPGHVLYANAEGISIPDVICATFERQTLP